MTSGEKTKAMADLNKAVQLDSKQLVAYFNRGQLHLANGEKANAKADFQAVLALAPNHKEAKTQLDAIAKAGG
jgi:tetratricopeptide (TPR) repeat protein